MKRTSFLPRFAETVFLRNIVLMQGLGLCPIIAVSTNLKYGVALTLCTAAVLLPTSLVMSLAGRHLPSRLRPPLYTLGATVLLLGAGWLINRCISHELYAALYLYLPLMAVNTIFSFYAGRYEVHGRPGHALLDALAASCGFGLVICLISCLRELLAYGTLWDVPLSVPFTFPQAALPFAGFLLLGLMGGLLQRLTGRPFNAAPGEEGGAAK